MNNTYSSWLPCWIRHGLGMLALLATVSTAQAQPTTPVTTPTVTTDEVTNIGAGSATVVGMLTSTGSTALTDYGVVYVQGTSMPTTNDTKVQVSNSSPAFLPSRFSTTVRMAPATTYTTRAYATNSGGTSYGNAITFGPVVSRLLSIERVFSGPTNASSLSYIVTFSLPVEGLTLRNFALTTTGNVAGASLQSLRSLGASATYSTTYGLVVNTGTGNGTLTLSLANTTGTLPGISVPVPTPGTPTYVIDKTPPTATISTTATNPASSSSIPVTVTFSESVTRFTANDIVVTNGTVTSALTNVGNAYSFTVTPTTNGLVTINVPANAAYDEANNGSTAAASLSISYVAPVTATTWTGASSTDWFTAGNWSAGIPTATIDATICPVSSSRYPVLSTGTATTRSLTINSGASLTMRDGTLDVRGNLTNNSAFVATGGTIVLGTSASSNILGSGITRFWSLRVEGSGALLATSAGATVQQVLTLNGNFSTNGNSFALLSTAAGTALVVNNGSNTVNGAVTVQRYIDQGVNAGLGYHHYSSPVANTTVVDFTTAGFAPVLNSAYNTSPTPNDVLPFPTVFGYDQALVNRTNATPNFDKGFFSPLSTNTPLVPGRGYDVHISATELVDFVGTLNNGPISVTTVRNAAGTLNAGDAGWQFLGNPYPAPLDYSLVAPADRAGLADAIYVYSSTGQYNGQYRAYINGIGGNPIIPVGQAFFAQVATPGTRGTFTFRNSQRLTSPNATPFQRTTSDPRPLVQLVLGTATGPADTFYAYAEAGATSALDATYDAPKLFNHSGLNLASQVGPERLAIDGRATFTAATKIPLAVSVPAAGAYFLSVASLPKLPAGLRAYLYDSQTGQTLLLAADTPYSFTVTTAQATNAIDGRFLLQFTPLLPLAAASLHDAEVTVYPNPTHERFTVQVPAVVDAADLQAALLNSLGQAVRRRVVALPATGATLTVETTGLTAGVYVLHLQAGNSTIAKRVVIN